MRGTRVFVLAVGVAGIAAGATGCGRVGFEAVPDAVGVAARSDAGALGDAGVPLLFHDGFEEPIASAWTARAADSGASLQAAITHSGGGALRARTPAPTTPTGVYATLPDLPDTPTLDARAWFYLPASLGGNHIDLLGFAPTATGGHAQVTLLTDQGQLVGFAQSTPASDNGTTVPTSVSLPIGAWFCIEVHAELSDTAGALEVRCNDQRVDQPSTSGATYPTQSDDGYPDFAVGMLFLQSNDGDETVYVDDVAVSTQPIGCGSTTVLPACPSN